jgi:predicted AAA+ superfamily ATPase
MRIKRILDLKAILGTRSAFLFGARGTGKTTCLLADLPEAKIYDLLEEQTYLRLLRDSAVLDQENPAGNALIVIDEIQKLPKLLDEVHRLITKKGHRFLLTGSSARKIKRSGANLLGGRARELHLMPLTWKEISACERFDLNKMLNRGGLPMIWFSDDPTNDLRSYISLYLREEVAAEALTRRVDQFSRFLDVIALNCTEELHFQNLANDSGVKVKTLANYIEILEDTLIGFKVAPFEKTLKRKAITRSKFFLFDIGVTNALALRGLIAQESELFGKAFEHFIGLEIKAFLEYNQVDLSLCYWRTKTGFEVDFILGSEVAIEVKSTRFATVRHLKGLLALKEENLVKNFIVICQEPTERRIEGVRVVPWEQALQELWGRQWF